PTTQFGEVEPGKYATLLAAIQSGKHADFEAIARGSGRRLTDPQAAYAFSLEGGDSHRFACPPAPSFSSPEMAAEVAELYWQALARDIPFRDYATSPLIQQAAQELNTTPRALFRGPTPGDLDGPEADRQASDASISSSFSTSVGRFSFTVSHTTSTLMSKYAWMSQ